MKPSRIVASSSSSLSSSSVRRTQQQKHKLLLSCHRRHSAGVSLSSHNKAWNEKRLQLLQSNNKASGNSVRISTTTCNDAPITLSSQVGSTTNTTSLTSGKNDPNTTSTDKRLLSSLSTVPISSSTTTASLATDVVVVNNNTMNHGSLNHQRSISKKNLEVMCLLQSLQNVVETQRSLGLFHRESPSSSSSSLSSSSPSLLNQETKQDLTSMAHFLTPWQEFDNNMDKIFDMKLSSSSSSSSSPTTTTPSSTAIVEQTDQVTETDQFIAEELQQQMDKNKEWYFDLKQAVDKRNQQRAMDLFYSMEKDKSFLHIIYNNNSNSNNVKPFFRTMNNLINSMRSNRWDRLDVAFDVFLRTESLCKFFQMHLNDRVQKMHGKNSQSLDDDMIHLLKQQNQMNDDERNFRLQQVKECRELLLFTIVSSMMVDTKSTDKVFRRQTYTKMVQHLFRIIKNDIRGDPILQLSLLSQLMASLMRQRFCSTLELKRTEKYIWDTSLSLLENELRKAQFTRTSGNDREDETFQVGNVTTAFGSEGLDVELSDLEPVQDVFDEHCDEFSTSHCRKLAGILPKFEALLEHSTFRIQADLPFVKLLEIIVSNGTFANDLFM